MSERERLPDRRGAELVDFEHEGRRWTVTAGCFDDGTIAERGAMPSPAEVRARTVLRWPWSTDLMAKRL